MNLILILIAEVCITSLAKNIIPYDIMELILLGVNIFLVGLYISTKIDNKKTFYIIYFGYLIRILFMFIDLYVGPLPFSGADTKVFHKLAIETAEMLPIELITTSHGAYAQFLGILYYFMGPVKMFAQQINIVLFILSTVTLYDIFNLYNVRIKYINIGLFVYILAMPVAMFESSILLREILIVYFLTLSIYNLLIYINKSQYINMLLTFIYLLLASVFHSGILILAIAYIYIFAIYNQNLNKFIVTPKSIVLLSALVIVLVLGYSVFGKYFTHVNAIESIDSILDFVNQSEIAKQSGSGYLSWLKVGGALGLIILTPLKLIYFMISPMPWSIRGTMDAITFLLDSMLYAIAIFNFIKLRKNKFKVPINILNTIYILYSCYIVAMIPYAWGTFAAGTAIRHRFKGFFILLIAYIIYKNYEENYKIQEEK